MNVRVRSGVRASVTLRWALGAMRLCALRELTTGRSCLLAAWLLNNVLFDGVRTGRGGRLGAVCTSEIAGSR